MENVCVILWNGVRGAQILKIKVMMSCDVELKATSSRNDDESGIM